MDSILVLRFDAVNIGAQKVFLCKLLKVVFKSFVEENPSFIRIRRELNLTSHIREREKKEREREREMEREESYRFHSSLSVHFPIVHLTNMHFNGRLVGLTVASRAKSMKCAR